MNEVKLTRGDKFKDARVVWNQHGKQSMKEVEIITGVSASLISELENDTDRKVNFQDIVKLASHYGVSLDYLIGPSDDPAPRAAAVDDLGLSPAAVAALRDANTNDRGSVYLLSRLLEGDLLEAIRDFRFAIKMESRYAPGNNEDMKIISELRSSEQERTMNQIGDLREKGASSELVETFLAMKSNLYPENISYFYLQEGLDTIRENVKRITREDGGGRKGG